MDKQVRRELRKCLRRHYKEYRLATHWNFRALAAFHLEQADRIEHRLTTE